MSAYNFGQELLELFTSVGTDAFWLDAEQVVNARSDCCVAIFGIGCPSSLGCGVFANMAKKEALFWASRKSREPRLFTFSFKACFAQASEAK